VAISATTVATSIAALSVAGVTLKDLTAIPENVEARDCPIIFPKPDGFMTNLTIQIDSFGSSSGKKTAFYDLNYTYCHSPLAAGRGLFDVYQDMVNKCTVFIDAVIANDALAGSIDAHVKGVAEFGPVVDPAGTAFHGATITIGITEFVN
jgi:hypothetical protein